MSAHPLHSIVGSLPAQLRATGPGTSKPFLFVFLLVLCSLALSPVAVSQNGASCDTVVSTGTSGGKRGGYRYYRGIWPTLNDPLTVAHRWVLPKRYKPMGSAVQLAVKETVGTLQLSSPNLNVIKLRRLCFLFLSNFSGLYIVITNPKRWPKLLT